MDIAAAGAKDGAVLHPADDSCRSLVEQHPYPLLVSVHGKIAYANPALLRLLRAHPSHVVGQSTLARVHPDFTAAAQERVNRALKTSQREQARHESWVRTDGSFVAVEVTVVPIPWAGQPSVALVLRDLTARTELETELQHLQEQLKTVTEQVSSFAIFALDSEGRVASWNSGASRVFGYSEAEILGKDFAILFTPEDQAAQAPQWERSQAAEFGLAQDERWHLRKEGVRRFLSGLLVSIRDTSGRLTGFTKVAQDHTERKMAEEALKQSEERLRRLAAELEERVLLRTQHLEQCVQTWESFCYSMAHDLRAPLRTISGFARALLDDYAPSMDATAQDYANRMLAAAQRLDEFIQDLLDFGRLAHLDLPLRAVNLGHAIDSVLSELTAEIASAGAQVLVQRPLPEVWANPAALEQVLTNLVTNALKFVAPGVSPHIEFRSEQTNLSVRLWIKDRGIGIEPEFQERVFELFERLHPQSAYPGTGVGLAIVRKAVERMGGKVGLESTLGEGTSFWIELPPPNPPPKAIEGLPQNT